jgi:hypothetical protein
MALYDGGEEEEKEKEDTDDDNDNSLVWRDCISSIKGVCHPRLVNYNGGQRLDLIGIVNFSDCHNPRMKKIVKVVNYRSGRRSTRFTTKASTKNTWTPSSMLPQHKIFI